MAGPDRALTSSQLRQVWGCEAVRRCSDAPSCPPAILYRTGACCAFRARTRRRTGTCRYSWSTRRPPSRPTTSARRPASNSSSKTSKTPAKTLRRVSALRVQSPGGLNARVHCCGSAREVATPHTSRCRPTQHGQPLAWPPQTPLPPLLPAPASCVLPYAGADHTFESHQVDWGFSQMLPLQDLNSGYLREDGAMVIRVEITIQRDERFTYDSRTVTGFVGLKNQVGRWGGGWE